MSVNCCFDIFPARTKPQTGAAKAGGERVRRHQEGDTVPCQIYDMNETNGSGGKKKKEMVGV